MKAIPLLLIAFASGRLVKYCDRVYDLDPVPKKYEREIFDQEVGIDVESFVKVKLFRVEDDRHIKSIKFAMTQQLDENPLLCQDDGDLLYIDLTRSFCEEGYFPQNPSLFPTKGKRTIKFIGPDGVLYMAKVMQQSAESDQELAMTRLVIASRNRNIVEVKCETLFAGYQILVMPYYPRQDLAEVLKAGTVQLGEKLTWHFLFEMARAFKTLRYWNIVHRDVKLHNIVVDDCVCSSRGFAEKAIR